MAGAALAAITGLCLFSVRPVEYAGNTAFLTKLALVSAGIANAALLHTGRNWRTAIRDGTVTFELRLQALASLLLWPAAIVAGRWIGFL